MELQDIQAAASAVLEQLKSHDKQLRAEHARLVEERRRVISAPEPVDVVVANMRQLVDDASARFAAQHAYGIVQSFSGHLRGRIGGNLSEQPAQLWTPPASEAFGTLCGLVPDIVKASLERIIRSHAYAPGIPLSERRETVRQVDAQIAEIERQHTEFVEECGRQGLTIEWLPAVAARRAAEEARAQRERAAEERRRELEAAVNAAMPRTPVRSQYAMTGEMPGEGR